MQSCIFDFMQDRFEKHINLKLDFLKNSKLIIAISGGIDSVVLTHLCVQLNLEVALAHCNFNLRGEESDADEDFVVELAENLDLEIFTERFDTEKYAKDYKRSIQMAARELRYNWFNELADQLGYDYILTAHHADDNLETFLINFSRGTGLEGLTGIPEVNDKFVRPLLPFPSHDIEYYAKENNIKWRDDSSNASVKYLRNKLRHEVIPVLKQINPSLLQSFQTTTNNLNTSSSIIEETIEAFLNKVIVKVEENEIKFKIEAFKNVKNSKAYLFEVFKEFGFTEWDDVLHLLDAETGKQVFSSTHRLIKNRAHLLLSSISSEENNQILISDKDERIEGPFGTMLLEEVSAISEQDTSLIYVDVDILKFPLKLRKKQEGDVFYPLGMKGKKKLSKYFKDEKLSLLDKENAWLLCSGDDIVWVVNRRADDRFKVTSDTKKILKIKLN